MSLIENVASSYGFNLPDVTPLDVPSSNLLYDVRADKRRFVLKIVCTSGTYHRSRIRDHVRYEAALVNLLSSRGIPTPAIRRSKTGLTAIIEGREAILYERFEGAVCENLEYPIRQAAAALAHLHHVQAKAPLNLTIEFSYETLCDIWLPLFTKSRTCIDLPDDLSRACNTFTASWNWFSNPARRQALFRRSPRLHCHGDVKPRNLILQPDGEVAWFDFDNALFAPRMADVIEGGISFALAEQHIDLVDFTRCETFIDEYRRAQPLSHTETVDLDHWKALGCLLQFTRELTTWVCTRDDIRRRRALAIEAYAQYLPTPSLPKIQVNIPNIRRPVPLSALGALCRNWMRPAPAPTIQTGAE